MAHPSSDPNWDKSDSRKEAALLGDEARIYRLELNYQTSAAKFGEAAALLSSDPEAVFPYLIEQGESLYLHGDEFGNNGSLVEAIVVFRQASELRPKNDSPLDWAATQHSLGNALLILGERESGTARLEEAVDAYRAALQEWTKKRVPLDWATATANHAEAMLTIAERQRDVKLAKQALSQLTATFEMLRDAGHADYAHYGQRVPIAQALVEQLSNEGPQTLKARGRRPRNASGGAEH